MVKELYEVYKCGKCGNMVEVVHAGGGELVCCGQPMKHLIENTTDAATEKHVPVIEQTAEGIRIRVGSAAHPMTDEHFIEWIQIILKDGRSLRHYLVPGQAPETVFKTIEGEVTAREFCNLHGLWKA
jgi:superoxide reductase